MACSWNLSNLLGVRLICLGRGVDIVGREGILGGDGMEVVMVLKG